MVYFDDGKVIGIVKNIQDKGVDLEVKMAGFMRGNSSVRFINGKHAQLPVVKKSDLEDLTKISQQNTIDFLAIPYVATATDIAQIKRALGPHGGSIGIIAKIDMDESLRNFEAIMKAADGAIINRKGLQWEFSPEKLMLAEKWLIQTSNNLAKPVMIQSQLLESTLENPDASRADLAEVANLVQLGADVFMLTTETSTGKFPQESMKILAKTIAEAE